MEAARSLVRCFGLLAQDGASELLSPPDQPSGGFAGESRVGLLILQEFVMPEEQKAQLSIENGLTTRPHRSDHRHEFSGSCFKLATCFLETCKVTNHVNTSVYGDSCLSVRYITQRTTLLFECTSVG